VYDVGNSSFFEPRKVRIAKKKILFGDSRYATDAKRVPFYNALTVLQRFANTVVVPVKQEQLSHSTVDALRQLHSFLDTVLESGGEGVVIRAPHTWWEPVRSHTVLKLKGVYEAEATVLSWTEGKGEDEGLIGALVVDWNGVVFKISGSGLPDSQRSFGTFAVGDIVTFKYRDLTKDGVPQEARYFRRRND
jgi:DNA ligase-1